MNSVPFLCGLCIFAAFAAGDSPAAEVTTTAGETDRPVRFSRDIRSILSDNCFQCHGPDAQQRKADLRIDTSHGIANVLQPGNASDSELVRRITSDDPDEMMPPPDSKKRLTAAQKQIIERWVDQGAPWETHWAFQPVSRPRLPGVARVEWTRNAIDRFVLARLESKGIAPSHEADRATLIRRLTLDLLGIVPTPNQVDAFVADDTPHAYENLVQRLLASPHFGERWGRHWLDQARYADSDGYAIDGARVMWPYRDWVIRALNADLPFDRFTIEQLAGDLFENAATDQLVATGFHRNTLINQEGGSDPEQFRNEAVVDRVNTTGAVWLGLTVGCAQCHAHKYDPISQKEYYQLFAFFNSAEDRNNHGPQIVAVADDQQAQLTALRDRVTQARNQLNDAKKQSPDDKAGKKNIEQALKEAEQHLRQFEQRFGKTMVMRELAEPRETFLLVRGDFLRRGEPVTANIPSVLGTISAKEPSRMELANWLVAQDNPLTARVTVNRIWMQYFGRGIVETENDFGIQGTSPSHPQLLDWLADELISKKWSLKAIHRLIVNSATYRQSSAMRADLQEVDPDNRLLARQSRLRVTSEILRDLALTASGLLNPRIGGPSVFPPQPEGIYAFTQQKKNWKTSAGADRFRRGMYTFFYRSAPHPFLTTFDTPNFQTTCTRRLRTNTPLQSLTMANDQAIVDAARALAKRVLADSDQAERRLDRAFGYCLSRAPSSYERERLLELISQQTQQFEKDNQAAREIIGEERGDTNAARSAAWVSLCRVLLNLDEFVTRE